MIAGWHSHERIIRQNPLLSLYFYVIGISSMLKMKQNTEQAISLYLFLSYRSRRNNLSAGGRKGGKG
jgi:hypothetical protein